MDSVTAASILLDVHGDMSWLRDRAALSMAAGESGPDILV